MYKTTNQDPKGSCLARLRAICPGRGLSRREALGIAERQADLLLQLSDVTATPVSLEVLANLPRIHLSSEAGLPSSGVSFWDGDSWRLIASAHEHEHHQRFSLAHEYKHVIDHPRRDLFYASDAVGEQAADQFAACLLMPRALVDRAWSGGVRDVVALAVQFAVLPAAMQRRLRDLGHRDRPHVRADGRTRELRTRENFAIAGWAPIGGRQ